MTESPKTIIHLVQCIWLPYLAANSLRRQSCRFKGISHHPCHAVQGKCSSTRQGYSISATCYTPHSPVISHSSGSLHSSGSSHTALEVYTALTHAHCPVGLYSPCSMYLVQQWFPAPSPLVYTSNYFLTLMTVKLRVFRIGRSSYAHFHSTPEP